MYIKCIRYGVCVCVSFLSPGRLPKNQECHEMWSRKKRKKEAAAAAAAAGGGAKEGTGSSNAVSYTHLTLPTIYSV